MSAGFTQTPSNKALVSLAALTEELSTRIYGTCTSNVCYDYFRRGVDPHAVVHGNPLLHAAAWGQMDDLIASMLDYGVDPFVLNGNDKDNTLHAAAGGISCSLPVAVRLLQAGLDPDEPNKAGVTAREMYAKSPEKLKVFQAAEWLHSQIKAGTADVRAWYDYVKEHITVEIGPRPVFVDSFPFLLEALSQKGDRFPKELLFDPTICNFIQNAIVQNPRYIPMLQTVCARQGEPMTYEDWQESDILHRLNDNGSVYALFSPEFWGDQPDLAPMLKLYEALDDRGRSYMESVRRTLSDPIPIGVEVESFFRNGHQRMAECFSVWCAHTEHVQFFKASDVRNFLKEIPDEVRKHFAGGHTLMANAQRRTVVSQEEGQSL